MSIEDVKLIVQNTFTTTLYHQHLGEAFTVNCPQSWIGDGLWRGCSMFKCCLNLEMKNKAEIPECWNLNQFNWVTHQIATPSLLKCYSALQYSTDLTLHSCNINRLAMENLDHKDLIWLLILLLCQTWYLHYPRCNLTTDSSVIESGFLWRLMYHWATSLKKR